MRSFESGFHYASVFRTGDEFHYYQVKNLKGTFQTEEEALAFGYDAARKWIAEPEKTKSISQSSRNIEEYLRAKQ